MEVVCLEVASEEACEEASMKVSSAEASVQAPVEVSSAKTFMEASMDDMEALGALVEAYELKRWKLP